MTTPLEIEALRMPLSFAPDPVRVPLSFEPDPIHVSVDTGELPAISELNFFYPRNAIYWPLFF